MKSQLANPKLKICQQSPLHLLWIHVFSGTKDMFREPTWLVSTLIFPAMFFWFFGVPAAKSKEAARMLMGSFSAYAVLGVVLFQFGVSIAQERITPWYSFLRTLPMPPWVPVLSRLILGLIFAILAVSLVVIIALTSTPLSLEDWNFGAFWLSLLAGAIPFGFIGLLIGLVAKPRAAVPIANLVYLPMSFAGGLWIPPNGLPKIIQHISEFLPSRFYGELMWRTLASESIPQWVSVGLLNFTLIFGFLCFRIWTRQEATRN